jgi:citrate lyase subunit beta / citryl-CoA lyase
MFRTMLFAPGNEPRKVQKVGQFGADAIILDLEDAVPNAQKVATRESLRKVLDSMGHLQVYVRVNSIPTRLTEEDIQGVVHPNLKGIVLPKAEGAEDIQKADAWLTAAEKTAGLPPGGLQIVPLIETTKGVLFSYDTVKASPRIPTAIFGSGDYTLDLDIPAIEWSPEGYELLYARLRLMVVCRAAGIQRPVDGPFLDVFNLEALRKEAILAKKIGFQGKLSIHPSHVAVIHEVFSPAPEEITLARKVKEVFEKKESSGSASITVDGKFIDYPIYYKAKKILEFAQAIEDREKQIKK